MTINENTTRRDVLRGGALGVGALVGGAASVADSAEAATPTFTAAATSGQQFWLSINGIAGPGTTRGFAGQLPVLSFAVGLDDTGAAGGAGRVTATTFDFTTATSKATPQLLVRVVTGQNIGKAVLTGLRTSPKGVEQRYLTITLHNLRVVSVHASESHGSPTDHVSLSFQQLTVTIDNETATYSAT